MFQKRVVHTKLNVSVLCCLFIVCVPQCFVPVCVVLYCICTFGVLYEFVLVCLFIVATSCMILYSLIHKDEVCVWGFFFVFFFFSLCCSIPCLRHFSLMMLSVFGLWYIFSLHTYWYLIIYDNKCIFIKILFKSCTIQTVLYEWLIKVYNRTRPDTHSCSNIFKTGTKAIDNIFFIFEIS